MGIFGWDYPPGAANDHNAPMSRERVPRIVVVGGARDTEQLKSVSADFRFWGRLKGESSHRLRALLKTADAAVIMTKFVSHKAQDIVRGRIRNGLQVSYCNGSLAEFKPSLENIARELQQAQSKASMI